MKKLSLIILGLTILLGSAFAFPAQAGSSSCACSRHKHWDWHSHWDCSQDQDFEYDWVIKPEVLGEKLKIIANPAFIRGPRGDEYIVITGDPDKWKGDTWGMKWFNQGYVAYIPLNRLPKNRTIRMNYVVMDKAKPIRWAVFAEDNDDEWAGEGDKNNVIIDFRIEGQRVVPVD